MIIRETFSKNREFLCSTMAPSDSWRKQTSVVVHDPSIYPRRLSGPGRHVRIVQ